VYRQIVARNRGIGTDRRSWFFGVPCEPSAVDLGDGPGDVQTAPHEVHPRDRQTAQLGPPQTAVAQDQDDEPVLSECLVRGTSWPDRR